MYRRCMGSPLIPLHDGVGVRMLSGTGCLTPGEGRKGTLRGFPHRGHQRNLWFCVSFDKKKGFSRCTNEITSTKQEVHVHSWAEEVSWECRCVKHSRYKWRRQWDVFWMLMAAEWSRTVRCPWRAKPRPPTSPGLFACHILATNFMAFNVWCLFAQIQAVIFTWDYDDHLNYFERQ